MPSISAWASSEIPAESGTPERSGPVSRPDPAGSASTSNTRRPGRASSHADMRASALVVTPGAVEKHVSSIFSKLNLSAAGDDHRRVLAVLAFLRATDGG